MNTFSYRKRRTATLGATRGTYTYPVKAPTLSAGMIFYRLNVNGLAITKKLIKAN